MDTGEQAGIETGQPVRLTVLDEPEIELLGQVVESSGTRLRLVVDRFIQQGAAVKVGFEQTLLLGVVCCCLPAGHEFELALDLEHSLVQTDELARLARKLLQEAPSLAPMRVGLKKKPSPPPNTSATP